MLIILNYHISKSYLIIVCIVSHLSLADIPVVEFLIASTLTVKFVSWDDVFDETIGFK